MEKAGSRKLPEPARIFPSHDCNCCGEGTAEHMVVHYCCAT